MANFSRLFTKKVPLSPASGTTPFELRFTPEQLAIPDLAFCYTNPNGFDAMLEGFGDPATFREATVESGWLMGARTFQVGPWNSKRPKVVSARPFATADNPLPTITDWSDRYILLIYGRDS